MASNQTLENLKPVYRILLPGIGLALFLSFFFLYQAYAANLPGWVLGFGVFVILSLSSLFFAAGRQRRRIRALVRKATHDLDHAQGELKQEIAERKRTAKTLETIVAGLSSQTGENYFRHLAQTVADFLGVKVVVVSQNLETKPDHLRTLSIWVKDKFIENIEYPLKGTPCEKVRTTKDVCFYPKDVEHLFPKDQWLKDLSIQSYIGVPLLDSHRQSFLGHLAVLNDQPMDDQISTETVAVLRAFAGRTSAEIQRLLMEDHLREENDRFELSSRGSNEGLWYATLPDHKDWFSPELPVYWSPRFKELLGYQENEFGNNLKAFWNHLHPDDFDPVKKIATQHLEERQPYDVEYRLRTKKGEYRWFRARGTAVWDEKNKPLRIAGSLMDITDRKLADEALRESEERFRQMAENIQDEVFWLTDPDINKMIYVSAAYENIWGQTCESLYQNPKSFLDPIHSQDKKRVIEALQHQAEGTYDEEYRLVRQDGSIRWIHDRGFPVRNSRGEVYRVCGIARDITAAKKAVEDLLNLEEQLRHTQKMEAIGTLAGGIAHDFNNMLAGILGNTDLQKIFSKPGEEVYESALSIERAAQRAAKLTKQLLEFARKEKRQDRLIDLHDTLKEVTGLLARTMSKNVSLRKVFNAKLHIVEGDADQLQQVILNLLVNARDAFGETLPSGEIVVETAEVNLAMGDRRAGGEVSPGPYIRVSIRDNGPGIPQSIQKRIFDPFFTTKDPGKGTGMGLSLAYGIIKNHGGSIRVSSAMGEGTTFNVYLPLSKKTKNQTQSKPHNLVTGTGKILIVDDEEMVRETAGKLLKQLGYEVLQAANAEEAIRSYRNNQSTIDLVLIDMVMPKVGGRDCFVELKKINPKVKAVLISGYGLNASAEEIVSQGMQAFVSKPFQIGQLSEVVARALN